MGRLRLRELKDEKGETSDYGSKAAGEAAPAEPGGAADPAAISHYGHRVQIAEFLAAIESGGDPMLTGEEARRPLELILAVYESARTGREVGLPLAVGR